MLYTNTFKPRQNFSIKFCYSKANNSSSGIQVLMSSSKAYFPQNLSIELPMDYSFWTTSEPEFILRGKQFQSDTKCMFKFFFIKSNLSTAKGLVNISAHWCSVSVNCIYPNSFLNIVSNKVVFDFNMLGFWM